jgi:hypothetical protein
LPLGILFGNRIMKCGEARPESVFCAPETIFGFIQRMAEMMPVVAPLRRKDHSDRWWVKDTVLTR